MPFTECQKKKYRTWVRVGKHLNNLEIFLVGGTRFELVTPAVRTVIRHFTSTCADCALRDFSAQSSQAAVADSFAIQIHHEKPFGRCPNV
jgi:hypothetical protein